MDLSEGTTAYRVKPANTLIEKVVLHEATLNGKIIGVLVSTPDGRFNQADLEQGHTIQSLLTKNTNYDFYWTYTLSLEEAVKIGRPNPTKLPRYTRDKLKQAAKDFKKCLLDAADYHEQEMKDLEHNREKFDARVAKYKQEILEADKKAEEQNANLDSRGTDSVLQPDQTNGSGTSSGDKLGEGVDS